MVSKIKPLSLGMLLALSATAAQAEIRFNGFASIQAGSTLSSSDSLYGFDNEVDFKNESLFALQAQADLGERLSVTAQLMGRGANDFKAEFEWAYLTYELNHQTRINAGRLRTPFYRYSDFMDVGYAYDWARVPRSVYNLDFNNLEGVSLVRFGQLGEVDSTLQLILGNYSGTTNITPAPADIDIERVAGATWELTQGNFTARLAYLTGKLTMVDQDGELSGLLNLLVQSGFADTASQIRIEDANSVFMGLALGYDNGSVVLSGEVVRARVKDTVIPTQNGYYLSAGYRINSYTPFVSFERQDNDGKAEIYQALSAENPFRPAVTGVVESFTTKRDTWNIGSRYDFHPSAALKVQYSSQKDKVADRRDQLLSVGIDLVF
ncbi:porin [Alkalimonas sp. MEB108]|uniref:Porin n=1 Tax=Alkalimonas cellulosilytica TaxID=3058395 RepID=A0ABU7J952_9GAMM|nr:porin [Alkalimonas sp. MEB108]MEE2003071.1 porin [Alkalimonas sp. MEB108]